MRNSATANYRANAKPCRRTAPARPALKLVKKSNMGRVKSRFSASIMVVVLGIILLIVVPVLINTQLAVLSFEINDANVEKANIVEDNQALQIKLVNAANPARISKIAIKNGLVPMGYSGVIDLKNQKLVKGAEGGKSTLQEIQILEDKKANQGVPTPIVNVDNVYNEVQVVK